MIGYDIIPNTIVHSVCVAASNGGLCAVLIADNADHHGRRLRAMFPDQTILHAPERVTEYRSQLEAYFAGERREFTGPFDMSAVKSDFQLQVLEQLLEVPFGQVVTYGDLAARVGSPDAARAVGLTMAANPLPIVVPCHRVVSATGLGGYSGGGVGNKRALLQHEGATPPQLF